MTPPSVSVIVPVRNGARTLPACLKALREQYHPAGSVEVIVVDDGSTDDTAALVDATATEFAENGNGLSLRLIRQAWRGAGAARNRGVADARGKIVLFTDADCEPVPGWILTMQAPFVDPEIAGVAGGYVTHQTGLVAQLAQKEFEERYRLMSRYTTVDAAFTHSAAFRRTVFLAAGGFDERMPNDAEDLELSYRLVTSGHRILFAPKGLVFHRHPETLVEYVRKKFSRGFWRTLVYKKYPIKSVRDSYTPHSLRLQIFLLGLAGISLPAAVVVDSTWLRIVGPISLGGLAATTLPFVWRIRGPLALRLLAPIFLISRAAAVGAGALCGLLDRIENYETGGRRR